MTVAPRLAPLRLLLRRFGLGCLLAAWLLRIEAMRVVRDASVEIVGGWETDMIVAGVPALGLLVALPLLLTVVAYATLIPMVQRRRGRVGVQPRRLSNADDVDGSGTRSAHNSGPRERRILAVRERSPKYVR